MTTSDALPRRVFISYAHESNEHMEAVRDLWILLRSNGVDAQLDRVAAERPQDWALWMADQIRDSDHILVIASAAYRERAEGRAASDDGLGVQYEARLIRDAFYGNPGRRDRFLSVVLPGQSHDGVPDFLAPNSNTVYKVTEITLGGAEALVRFLTGQPGEVEPPLGPKPHLPARDHTLPRPSAGGSALRHDVALYVEPNPEGGVRTRTELAGSILGEQVDGLPAGVLSCWSGLDGPGAGDRLIALGRRLWDVMLNKVTGGRLVELIDRSPMGSVINIVVHLSDELAGLPVELLRLPDGRLAATVPGVRFTRRLVGVERPPTQPLAGPLKILAAVAAPDETATKSAPLDVEAEMQALLDAVTDLDLGPTEQRAQVRILEVASLAEISKALAADQYHVLHLSAHGSPNGVELADEDGNPEPADTDQLVAALRAGEHPLPLVVLSSCHGASGDPNGLAATLIRHGADRVIAMQTTVTDTFATHLARELYRILASSPQVTVAQALATARRIVTEQLLTQAREAPTPPRPEFAVPTLLAAGEDPPLRDLEQSEAPLKRAAVSSDGRGVRELPIGQLIGRRAELRTATAVLRGNTRDRETVGAWSGVALTGIGGIGKTALAGRILARAREHGWMIAEHVGPWNPPALFAAVHTALAERGLHDVAAAVGDPARDDADKLGIVATMLAKAKLLVLFDDFEQNLDEQDSSAFRDPGFADIFHALCANARAGRVLVTCRYPVPDTDDTLLRITLPALTKAELQRLFLRLPALRDLPADDRRLITRTIGGHPRLIEFLDVLLRHGTTSRFQHVTAKLRNLATQEGIDLRPDRPLTTGVSDVVRLGSRDILLDALQHELTTDQHELLLQAALAQASFTPADLVHTQHGTNPTPDQTRAVTHDIERLVDLTLLSPPPTTNSSCTPGSPPPSPPNKPATNSSPATNAAPQCAFTASTPAAADSTTSSNTSAT